MSSVKTRKLDISTILAVVKAQTQSGAIEEPLGSAVLRETKPNTVNSSVIFTDSVRVVRQINDIQFNNLDITISGSPNWFITIPTKGTYTFRVRGTYTATRTGINPYACTSKVFIRNETLNLDNWIVGENSKTCVFDNTGALTTTPFNSQAECNGTQTITEPTTISVRQICTDFASVGNKIGGAACFMGANVPEVYVTLEIQKIA
jgi:hypothetical protein